jgi:predicted nucleic acid-binding protein
MAKKIIADSGYWFALFNERDAYHCVARVLEDEIQVHKLLVPWPTLYEAMNTRFIRRKHDVIRLERYLELPSTVIIEDAPYREASLTFVLEDETHTYSLVDHVIRSMLADVSLSIDAFISFNPNDFHDVCDARRIEMLYR